MRGAAAIKFDCRQASQHALQHRWMPPSGCQIRRTSLPSGQVSQRTAVLKEWSSCVFPLHGSWR